MKKLIALGSVLAISSFAIAQGTTDTPATNAEMPKPQMEQPQNMRPAVGFNDGKQTPQVKERQNGARGERGEHRRDFNNNGERPPMGMHGDRGGERRMEGGFIDESKAIKTAKDAQAATERAPVILEGSFVKQVGKRDFVFKDASGEIEVEVPRHAWDDQTITPNDKVRLTGHLDKDWGKVEVEIRQVTKL